MFAAAVKASRLFEFQRWGGGDGRTFDKRSVSVEKVEMSG